MNEIIAAIVGGILAFGGTYLFYYIKNRQGNRIIIKRVSETPQIKISLPVQRDLVITYRGQPVDNLVLNTLVISNNGNEVIKPVEFKLLVGAPAGLKELVYLESEENDPLDRMEISKEENSFRIKRPYLNPKRKFKEEEIKLAIFSNTRLNFSVEGGGEGWYARFDDSLQKTGLRRVFSQVEIKAAMIAALVLFFTACMSVIIQLLADFLQR